MSRKIIFGMFVIVLFAMFACTAMAQTAPKADTKSSSVCCPKTVKCDPSKCTQVKAKCCPTPSDSLCCPKGQTTKAKKDCCPEAKSCCPGGKVKDVKNCTKSTEKKATRKKRSA